MQHLGVDLPADQPLKVIVWHALIERYIEAAGFQSWTHLHPTFYMEVTPTPHHTAPSALPPPHHCLLSSQNLISYGGVPTIRNKTISVPFKQDAKVSAPLCPRTCAVIVGQLSASRLCLRSRG